MISSKLALLPKAIVCWWQTLRKGLSLPFAIAAIITGRTLVVMMVVLAVMLVGCLASGGGHDGNDHDHVDRHFG